MSPPDASRSAPGRPTGSSTCRGGRRDHSTTPPPDPEYDDQVGDAVGFSSDPLTAVAWDAIRPSLRATDEERAHRLAEARRAIEDHAAAVRAVRLLESVARGPKVHSPRTMARALRELADHFEAAA